MCGANARRHVAATYLLLQWMGLEILWKAFQCAPTDWFVDGIHHCMVASGHLVVQCPALAGSMNHYSERSGRVTNEYELAETRREGELLELGRICQCST